LREALEEKIQAGLEELDAVRRVASSEVYAEARSHVKAVLDEAGK